MAERVHLVVIPTPVDADGFLEDPGWVFIHTDPSSATVTTRIDRIEPGGVPPTVISLTPATGSSLAVPPYYNTVLRIDNLPSATAFRLYINATDSSGGRQMNDHSLLLTRRKKGFGGPTIRFGSPAQGSMGARQPVSVSGFVVCGFVNPYTSAMSVWLIQESTGSFIPGVCVKRPPPPYDWAFQFGSLPAPGNYTCNAEANGDTTTLVSSYLIAS